MSGTRELALLLAILLIWAAVNGQLLRLIDALAAAAQSKTK